MRDNVDQPQGCGEREGMCAWCKPDMHTCVAPLSRERVKEREREREREETVNRICMETVCQWVASSCGYLTLFSLPLFPFPSSYPPTFYPHLQRVPRTLTFLLCLSNGISFRFFSCSLSNVALGNCSF